MLEEILNTRIMVKNSMKKHKGDKVWPDGGREGWMDWLGNRGVLIREGGKVEGKGWEEGKGEEGGREEEVKRKGVDNRGEKEGERD
jgi:hypothetical protein